MVYVKQGMSSISFLIAAGSSSCVIYTVAVYADLIAPDNGWKDCLKDVERFARINNFR
jgi:hypothetical protein